MFKSMKFLTLLQLGVLGASGAFIYNKDFKTDLSKKVASYLKSAPAMNVSRIADKTEPAKNIANNVIQPMVTVVDKATEDKVKSALVSNSESNNNDRTYQVSQENSVSAAVNYSLLYESISFAKIIEKSWNVDLIELSSLENKENSEYLEVEEAQVSELFTEEVSSHFGFVQEEKIVVESWANNFKGIDFKEMIAAKEESYEETVSEDVITQNRSEQEKMALELMDEVASAASSLDKDMDASDKGELSQAEYSPTKLEFTKINKKELTSQYDLEGGKLSHGKVEKIDLKKMLEESNSEFEKLDLEEASVTTETENDEYSENSATISSNVSMAIQREMEKRIVTQKASVPLKKQAILAQSMTTQSKSFYPLNDEKELAPEVKRSTNKSGEIKNRITAYGIDLESGKNTEIRGFDLSYSYEYNSNLSDDNTGAVDFSLKSFSSNNVLRVNLRGDNEYLASNADLGLEDGVQFSIPLLSREGLYKFFEKKSLNGIGSIVLVELAEATNSVDISSAYEGKVYFDENFKEVEMQEAAHYVLFVGVKPGNALLSFQTVDNEVVDKIINTTEDELYFEANEYHTAKRESVQIFEKKLLSNERVPLELFKEKINYFNTNILFEKKAQNTYSYMRPRMSLGMRKYFEINRDQGLLVVGYGDNNQIEIPSENLIGEYQNIIGNESDQSCYIQTNIDYSKELKDIQYNGHSTHGDASNMNIDMLAIDSDGQHGEEIADKTKTIILSSNQQGTISLRVDYQDNTSHVFNTFCSPGTYLVEQL
jgi:hypothetical protein